MKVCKDPLMVNDGVFIIWYVFFAHFLVIILPWPVLVGKKTQFCLKMFKSLVIFFGQDFTNLDFPEIKGFPFLNATLATFWGPKTRVCSVEGPLVWAIKPFPIFSGCVKSVCCKLWQP